MRKIILKKELICPFDKCRTAYGQDKEGNVIYHEMGVGCENCEYVWNRSTITLERPSFYLDENCEEYKEYEKLYTPVCIDEEV